MSLTSPANERAEPDPAAVRANRWRVPAEDFAHLQAAPVLCRLADQSVLEFEGADALSFLQSQTTADIGAMSMQSWQLGGYCTPKGRLLAVFQAWRYENGVRLLVPAAIAPALLRRLSMYVLRASVRARDASRDWAAFAVVGLRSGADAGAQAVRGAGLEPPEQAWQAREAAGGARIATLPGGSACGPRWLCVLPAAEQTQWLQRLGQLPLAESALFWWSQIDAAIPAVFADTSELFVPQTVNLEVLGGVSFRKGCYPGQEVVARSQYLGKLRRRMAAAHAQDLGPGPDVYATGQSDPVGRIVMAATAPAGGWDLLYESATHAAVQGQGPLLHAGAADAPTLQARALPYAIFDPTQ